MSLRAQIQADFDGILAGDDLAEEVVYTPKGGEPVTILAHVFRGPLASYGFDRNTRVEYKLAAWLSRSDVPTLKLNVDTITCKEKEQDAEAQPFVIRSLLSDTDPAGLLVSLS